MAYIYDSSLSLNKEIAVDELLQGDFVISETGGVAASTDGKKLADNARVKISANVTQNVFFIFISPCSLIRYILI